eukprot:SAG31_NODE_310_length_17887_cov_4.623060_14_plen_84_part_00
MYAIIILCNSKILNAHLSLLNGYAYQQIADWGGNTFQAELEKLTLSLDDALIVETCDGPAIKQLDASAVLGTTNSVAPVKAVR